MAPGGRTSPPSPPGISRAEVMGLIELIRNSVNDSSARALQMNNDAITKIGELKRSLEFTQAQVDEYKTLLDSAIRENAKLRTDNGTLYRENNIIKEEMQQIVDQVDYIDDYSRCSNLRISGLPETPNET